LEGLKIALDNIDAVIATIRRSQSTETARRNLMKAFTLSEVQANAILDMRLARLAALERKKVEDELKEVRIEIARLEAILADPKLVLAVIRQDLATLKEKYGDVRRTEIKDSTGILSEDDLIPEVNVLVTLTTRNYIKRSLDTHFRTQHRGGKGVTGVTMRDEDAVKHILAANTHDSLLVFTNRGKVYHLKVHELPDASRTARGVPIINLVNMQPDETVTTLLKVKDFSSAKHLFFTTRLGRIKRTSLDQFQSVRSSGLIAIGLDEQDELAWVRMTSGKNDIVLVTVAGQAIRFDENDVRSMGRQAAGVIGIRLGKGDRIVSSEVVHDGHDLFIVAARGFGKRTRLQSFKRQARGGKGVTAMRLTPKTGRIVSAAMITSEHEVAMMSSAGKLIRIPGAQIPCIGRATQGVTLMRMDDDELVVAMTASLPQEGDGAGVGELNGHSLELTAG
nr:DNA gyrase subunit A [Chloroflexia bacterium]